MEKSEPHFTGRIFDQLRKDHLQNKFEKSVNNVYGWIKHINFIIAFVNKKKSVNISECGKSASNSFACRKYFGM